MSYATAQSPAGSTPRTPRVIDERYVVGEGMCYVYEDGSRVQKVIDGEGVNPQWGVTKAGKPRKRLAQACTTCREKKIKCDPSSPKCIQCQKFGRECKFENAPRGHHHHMSSNFTPNMARPTTYEQSGIGRSTSGSERSYAAAASPTSIKRPADDGSRPGSVHSEVGIDARYGGEGKRQRRGSATHPSDRGQQMSKSFKGKSRGFDTSAEISKIGNFDSDSMTWPTGADWRVDPWDVDPESADYHLQLYLDHVNSATYCIFPRKAFTTWCQTWHHKSANDRMLIYSVLAMGSAFSDRPDRKTMVRKLLNAAEFAVQNTFGKFSLQLAQSRLILALLNFSLGHSNRAWDHCGSALRVACGLDLNIEKGVCDVDEEQELDYGLNRAALEECHRRTFWSAFIMDRFNGFCSGHVSIINIDDCFLRLPMPEAMYEDQISSATPYFQNNVIDPMRCAGVSASTVGSMAHLVNVSAAWGETMAFIYRASYLSVSDYLSAYESHYASIVRRLIDWKSTLPHHLEWSQNNLDRSIRHGYIGTFMSLHSLYHATLMKLNRHVRLRALPPESVSRNVRAANYHARCLLDATRALARMDREARLGAKETSFAFSTPFTGYAVLVAIDVLTAGGSLSELPDIIRLVDSGLEVIEELASFWAAAKTQFRHVGERMKALAATLAEHGPNNFSSISSSASIHSSVHSSERRTGITRAFVLSDAIDSTHSEQADIVYGIDRREYLKLLGIDLEGGGHQLVIVESRGLRGVGTEYI